MFYFALYSYAISEASIHWLVYMDRLLTLGDDCFEEKKQLEEKMIHLVNLYYDALDAPKSGLKVCLLYYMLPLKLTFFSKVSESYYISLLPSCYSIHETWSILLINLILKASFSYVVDVTIVKLEIV